MFRKVPTKNHSPSRCFDFAISRHSIDISPKMKWTSPKDISVFWSTVSAIFSKLSTKWSCVYKFLYRNLNWDWIYKIEKTISLLITIKISLNIQKDNLDFLLRFVNNQYCVFSIKKVELQCDYFILTEFANINHRRVHHLHKNRSYVAIKGGSNESKYDVWRIHPCFLVCENHY